LKSMCRKEVLARFRIISRRVVIGVVSRLQA
jgi:hypothetical protein